MPEIGVVARRAHLASLDVLKLSLRNLLAHKVRFFMTTFAVVLGVGFVVGSFVLTDTLRESLRGLFTSISEGVDVTVQMESLEGGGTGGFGSRGLVPQDVLAKVQAVDGVREAEGSITALNIVMIGGDGEPLTTTGAPSLGVTWGDSDTFNPLVEVEGERPSGPNEVAIDVGSAEDGDLSVGDTTAVILPEGRREVEVVGIFSFGTENSLLGARLTAFDPEVATEAFQLDGFEAIGVAIEDGVSAEEMATRIGAVLPEGAEAITGEESVDQSVSQTDQFVGIFQNVLLGFAGVALFVSAFYINNTFAIVLGQRVREMALLRALGAGARQLRRTVMLESFIIGLLASLVGILAGIGVAKGISAALSATGVDLPASGTILALRTWIVAFVIGVGVTMLSSIAPARRAARVAPVEGMRDGILPDEHSTRRLVIGGIATALGVLLVALGLFVIDDTATVFMSLALGAVLIFLGVAGISPVIAVPVTRVLGAPFARISGKAGALARSNAMRSPHRTARTASALMIGLALVTTVYVIGDSIKTSFAASIQRSVKADYVLTGESNQSLPPAVAGAVAPLPEISAISGTRFDRFSFDGTPQDLVAMEAASLDQLLDVDIQDGSLEALDAGGIFIHEDVARDEGLSVGDTVAVQFASGGPRDLEIAGIHADATYVGNFLIDMTLFDEAYPTNTSDFFVFLRAADGVSSAQLEEAVEAATKDLPPVTFESRSEFQASQEDQIDQLLAIVNALLGLALIIALLGIANTLALSVIERTREIGLLRAVGMSRRQTRRMVRIESVLVSVFGAALGVGVGLLFGIAAATALPESIVTSLSVPVGSIVMIVIIAAVFGVIAAWLPARRAARMDVLRALTHD